VAVIVESLGVGVPERRVSNEELASRVDTTDEWIRSHTGIGSRRFAADGELTSDLAAAAARVAADGELTSDLAAAAAREALGRAGLSGSDLDFIVLATATPDFFGFPSTACIVQDKIGARGCPAFDLTAGCTGFIYALDVARSLLETSRGRRALVIGAETLSRVVNWEDRSTCVLLGDGAGAALLSRVEGAGGGILASRLEADGAGAGSLRLAQAGRSRTYEREAPMTPYLEMDGRSVYNFAVGALSDIVGRLLADAGREASDLAWIVPHQANARIIRAAAKRLGLPEGKFYMNIEEYANTSSASIPIALREMETKGLLAPGDLLMLIGFGSGLTSGGVLLRWDGDAGRARPADSLAR
jgi:3-oxoacyl-[acyl-carrier-protein] synthase III